MTDSYGLGFSVENPEADYGLRVVVPPYAEPVHLTAMKSHCRIDASDDDDLVRSMVGAARSAVEAATAAKFQRSIVPVVAKYQIDLYSPPRARVLELPRAPLVSVISITYTDTNGNAQTFSADNYSADTARSQIVLAWGINWPVTQIGYGAMTVTFWAGIATPVTIDGDTVTFKGRSPVTGERVRLINSGGSLPGGALHETDYFVVDVDGQDCGFSLESGGAAVEFGDSGVGAHFALVDTARFQAFTSAMKLLCGHWYENREAVNVGSSVTEMPMAVKALAAAAAF